MCYFYKIASAYYFVKESTMPTDYLSKTIRKISENDIYFLECEFVGENFSDEKLRLLVEALKKNKVVHTLKFTCNAVSNGDMVKLLEIFKENKTIHTVEFGFNKLGDEGARILSKLIEENQSINYLFYQFNDIGVEGVRFLVESLRRNKSLLNLSLRGNYIGDEGACALAEVLRENRNIQMLDLYACSIGDKGVEAIANTLNFNTSIFQMTLSGNKLTPKAYEALTKMLRNNFRIVYINADSNDDRWENFIKRNKVIAPYFDLLHFMSRVAVSRKLPDEIEKKRIQKLVRQLETKFSRIIWKANLLETNDGCLELAKSLETFLNFELGCTEFQDLNAQSFGIKATVALLKTEKYLNDGFQSEIPSCVIVNDLMQCIPREHPLRSVAHLRAVEVFRKNVAVLSEKEVQFLSCNEVTDVVRFLLHCALAKKITKTDSGIPIELESRILSYSLAYLSGSGWRCENEEYSERLDNQEDRLDFVGIKDKFLRLLDVGANENKKSIQELEAEIVHCFSIAKIKLVIKEATLDYQYGKVSLENTNKRIRNLIIKEIENSRNEGLLSLYKVIQDNIQMQRPPTTFGGPKLFKHLPSDDFLQILHQIRVKWLENEIKFPSERLVDWRGLFDVNSEKFSI